MNNDLISRESLKEAIIEWFNLNDVHDQYWWNRVRTIIDNAPTVIDGTVLPIGHGRLIDADYIKLFSIDHDSWNGVEYEGVIKVVPVIAIDNAPTIIEADKEAENDNE